MDNANDSTEQQWQARLLAQGLAQLKQAMLIVSSRGDIVFSSKAAQEIVHAQMGLEVMDGILKANPGPDNQRLQAAIERAINEQDELRTTSIYLHREGCSRPMHLTISKMSKSEGERRQGHHVLILIKDLDLNQTYWSDRLKEEYRLSEREIQCVTLLAEGREIKDLANIMEIGVETVRQYVKNVYKKMGVHKQHELVSLALEYRRNR